MGIFKTQCRLLIIMYNCLFKSILMTIFARVIRGIIMILKMVKKYSILIFMLLTSCNSFYVPIKTDKPSQLGKAYFYGRFLKMYGDGDFHMYVEKTQKQGAINFIGDRKTVEIKYYYDLCDQVVEVVPGNYRFFCVDFKPLKSRYGHSLRVQSEKFVVEAGKAYYLGDWKANNLWLNKKQGIYRISHPERKFKERTSRLSKIYPQLFKRLSLVNVITNLELDIP